MTLCYSFYADRTHFFKKAHKEYSSTDFKAMCLAALTLGVLSIQRSSSPVQKSSRSSIKKQKDHSFLSRDQTNEWKGWMQFIILIYHYTGASKILEIYIIIRVLVASYLFMTGFGHTVFFYQKGDYSLRRCASVLIKLNLLSSILPYIMNTDYLFYYFAPLISFWYLVIYFTMIVASSRNKSALLLFSKIAISAIIITSLIRIPSIFEWLFLVLARICNIHWNVAEWRFRLQLDAYIVYFGMLSAVLFIKIGSAIEDEATESKFFGFIRRYWFPIRAAATFLALIILPVFWHLAQRSSNKYDYNLWEPYVSAFPILAYIILRNCNRYARKFHSALFAWLGLHSLETFTLQFHIWLAADTKGLLALGIFSRNRDYVGGRWPDFLVITTLFLWISWHVAAATTSITSWIVDPGAGESEVGREGMATIDLPATSSYVNLYGQADRSFGETGWRSQMRKACRVFKEHLRVRLAIILIVMWLLNMVSFLNATVNPP